jgi:cytoskeletal protein CcmA (bactofilin family)
MAVWRSAKSTGDSGNHPPEARRAEDNVSASLRWTEGGETVAHIGKSITIKGDLAGEEDLVLDGRIEGRVELPDHHLTIGPNGHVQAELSAKEVTIDGKVNGNVTATDRVEIRESGRLEGDVVSPRLLIQEGAELNGKVSMKAPTVAAVKRPPPLDVAAASNRPS